MPDTAADNGNGRVTMAVLGEGQRQMAAEMAEMRSDIRKLLEGMGGMATRQAVLEERVSTVTLQSRVWDGLNSLAAAIVAALYAGQQR